MTGRRKTCSAHKGGPCSLRTATSFPNGYSTTNHLLSFYLFFYYCWRGTQNSHRTAVYGCQRTTLWGQFSLPTFMWVLGVQSRLSCFLLFSLFIYRNRMSLCSSCWNTLCIPGWPRTQRSPCLCFLLSTRIKGVRPHT